VKTATVICEQCGKHVERPQKEVTRSLKLGRRIFCSNSCGAKYNNECIPRVRKQCQICGDYFETKEYGKGANTFCSRVCANQKARTLSPEGLEKLRQTDFEHEGNLNIASAMKSREAWKYVELEERLQSYPHEFECKIGDYIFDLVLPCFMVAVEFDGPDHRREKQRLSDAKKTQTAEDLGYIVLRREVKRATVIPNAVLDGVVP
jgi:very-short-patch-repair endonuclease